MHVKDMTKRVSDPLKVTSRPFYDLRLVVTGGGSTDGSCSQLDRVNIVIFGVLEAFRKFASKRSQRESPPQQKCNQLRGVLLT